MVNAPEVVGVGMCTVDFLFAVPETPQFGQAIRASHYLRQGGGPVATALCALARLGIPTEFIGLVGDDVEGFFIRDELVQQGVGTSRLQVMPGHLSRIALVLVEQNSGERGFIARPETCPPLKPEELKAEEITCARILHLDDADEASIQAARWARQAGVEVVFDGTWPHAHLEKLLELVDYPILSEILAKRWMPGAEPEKVAERLCAFGGQSAIVTLGERGCVVRGRGHGFEVPAFPIEVVDTTGAGDAFHGGFIYGLLQGWGIGETVRFAAAVAALNCLRLGGRTGLPSLREVEEFLRVHPGGCDE